MLLPVTRLPWWALPRHGFWESFAHCTFQSLTDPILLQKCSILRLEIPGQCADSSHMTSIPFRLVGHSSYVRGLLWHTELPHVLQGDSGASREQLTCCQKIWTSWIQAQKMWNPHSRGTHMWFCSRQIDLLTVFATLNIIWLCVGCSFFAIRLDWTQRAYKPKKTIQPIHKRSHKLFFLLLFVGFIL